MKLRTAIVAILISALGLAIGCTKAKEAYQNRNDSTDSIIIRNNLNQLSEAGRVYALEHNVSVVRFENVVGPQEFVKKVVPVDGEDYRQFDYGPNTNSWTIVTKRGLTVTFERPPRPNQAPAAPSEASGRRGEPTPGSVTPRAK
jgi:hypothetical protein